MSNLASACAHVVSPSWKRSALSSYATPPPSSRTTFLTAFPMSDDCGPHSASAYDKPGTLHLEHFICAPIKISELWWSFLQNPQSNSCYCNSYFHVLLVSKDISSLNVYYSLQEIVFIFSFLSTHIGVNCVMMK